MMDSPAPLELEVLVATCAPDGTLITSNEAWRAAFGADGSWSRLSPDDRQMAVDSVKEAGRGQLVTHQIFPIQVPKRDEPLPVLLNFLPVHLPGDDDQPPAVSAVTITGEVLAEPTSWTASQTQRHRLETLGRMTMGIAHDFNNLLSGILGYTELLKLIAVDPEHTDTYDDHLQTVERAALDGAALVRKIQQFIRQEKETIFEPLAVPDLIEECISLTRPYWYNEPRRKSIEIELETRLGSVPPVMGNATELREVLVNLILNAVQAMPRGGTLYLGTDVDERNRVVITVQDSGTGMTETIRKRIFEPLFTTKGERGTGMGLAVSYGIVQSHDGRISVESTLGEGTTFTILLPPAEQAVPAGPSPDAAEEGRSARVLLVDDEVMVRTVLSKLLALRGHDVDAVASGPEALERTNDEAFDIVILDQAMPEMNGREVARRLRARFPGLALVLLTGDTEIGDPGGDLDVILQKPFQIDEVEATIQRLVHAAS